MQKLLMAVMIALSGATMDEAYSVVASADAANSAATTQKEFALVDNANAAANLASTQASFMAKISRMSFADSAAVSFLLTDASAAMDSATFNEIVSAVEQVGGDIEYANAILDLNAERWDSACENGENAFNLYQAALCGYSAARSYAETVMTKCSDAAAILCRY